MTESYRAERGSMAVIAVLLGDPNPLHFDRQSVARRGLGDRLVLQGPVTASVAYEAVRSSTGRSIQSADLTFRGVAVEGDLLSCDVRVIDEHSARVVVTTSAGAIVADGRVVLAAAVPKEQ